MFRIGEKVVCIGKVPLHPTEIETTIIPIVNEIYTIREFDFDDVDGISIRLEEIINPIKVYVDGVCEKAFLTKHFRKLDDTFAENLLKEITRKVKEETLSLSNK